MFLMACRWVFLGGGVSVSFSIRLRWAMWLPLLVLVIAGALDDEWCRSQGPSNRNCVPDVYPTRQGKAGWLPRIDPVLWNLSSDLGGPLSAEQLQIFERDGAIVLPSFFSQTEINAIYDEVMKFARTFDTGREQKVTWTSTAVTESGTSVLRSLFAFHKLPRSNLLRRLANEHRLVAMAKQILGDEVYVFQSRINLHQALKAEGFGWHSDFETWHAEDGMPRMRAASIAVMLQNFTVSNGALMVIPGSHKSFILSSAPSSYEMFKDKLQRPELERSPDKETMLKLVEQSVDRRGIEQYVGPAGSIVIFDCNLMHASQKNMSPFDRTSLFIAFNAVENMLTEPFSAASPRPEHLATRATEFHGVPVEGLELQVQS